MKQTQLGFTLIELMVTVAIVGILASIAYPSYQDSVRKSRRADAEGVMLGMANAMERRFTETNSYCDAAAGGTAVANCGTATGDTGTPSIYTIPPATATYYTVTISAVSNINVTAMTASGYTLSAVPAGAQAIDTCSTLTLAHTGVKSPTTAGCW